MSSGFYLRKDQKTFGPLTAEEIATLKSNGEISNYGWIWTPETKAWAPLELAPPSPETAEPIANAVIEKNKRRNPPIKTRMQADRIHAFRFIGSL